MSLSYSPLCVGGYGWDYTAEECVECHENCLTCYGSLESECTQCSVGDDGTTDVEGTIIHTL